MRNLVIRKRIQTTFAKAKEASAFADQMITLAKRGDLHARRVLISRLGCSQTAHTLITQIAPHFKERQGGYTRVLHLGNRKGDNAQTALLEFSTLIEAPEKTKKPKKEKKPKEVKHEHAPKPAAPAKETKAKGPEDKDKKESEKKGGFLSTLRKFLKGDDQ